MRKLLALLLIFTTIPMAQAAPCQNKVCIKVYTDPATGRVVIEAKKGKPKVVATYKPVPKVITPRPTPTRTWKPRPYTPRPRVSKRPALSLADKLAQLIPNREITKVPIGDALVQVPIKFSTNTDLVFQSLVNILGVGVLVHLTPTFAWNFGDGATSGASVQQIEHTYKSEGVYNVTLRVSWSGNWLANGIWAPITGGAIIKTMNLPVTVKRGPIKYGK
jgi:PKD domain